jgi:hypothetical protein
MSSRVGHSIASGQRDFGINRVARFAPCPPPFGLLLDLRKTHCPTDTARLFLCRPEEIPETNRSKQRFQQQGWGERQSEVKEEPRAKPLVGDTNGGVYPSSAAGA